MLTQAVESLLNQTYTDIRVVVVNDGGKPVKLPTDPRIVLFEADRNRGCYYSESLVLAACKTEWWTVHASDDWSDPHRFQTLLDASEDVEAVTSPTIYHWPDRDVHDPVNAREQGHGTLGTISRHPAHIYRAEISGHGGCFAVLAPPPRPGCRRPDVPRPQVGRLLDGAPCHGARLRLAQTATRRTQTPLQQRPRQRRPTTRICP
jgi:hypothetical protein